ncbi:MAG: hypothetical protein FWD59_02920 [Micrococcales bacterium]|nr:hypothetical protein [Micrococcales bacterium]
MTQEPDKTADIAPLTYPTCSAKWIAPIDPTSNRELFDYLDYLDATAPPSPSEPYTRE